MYNLNMTASSPLPVSQNQTIGNSTLTGNDQHTVSYCTVGWWASLYEKYYDRIIKDEDDYDTRKMFIQVSVVFAVTCGLILRSFYTVCWEEKQARVNYLSVLYTCQVSFGYHVELEIRKKLKSEKVPNEEHQAKCSKLKLKQQ